MSSENNDIPDNEVEAQRVKIALGLEKDPNRTAKRDLFARKSSDPKVAIGVLGDEKWESTTYYV